MKKLLLATFAALTCLSSHAELIYYKLNYTVTRTGGGTVSTLKTTGWAVIDFSNAQLAFVKSSAKYKTFNIDFPSFTPATASGKNKFLSTIRIHDGVVANLTLKGTDNAKNQNASPSTLIVGGMDAWEGDGMFLLDEYTGNAIFDKARTTKANQDGLTFDEAIEELSLYFQNMNYSQLDYF